MEEKTMGKLRNMTGIYLYHNNRMLLLYRQGSKVVNNVWVSSAGGHFEPEELNDARACVLRELQEELSITEDMLQDFCMKYVTIRRTKSEIRQNYYFFAELKNAEELPLENEEGKLQWFDFEEVNSLEMPFTAQYVVKHYLEEGRYTDKIYGGIANGEEVVFTELVEF